MSEGWLELQFKYYIGTRVIFEKSCVQLHKAELGKYGGGFSTLQAKK